MSLDVLRTLYFKHAVINLIKVRANIVIVTSIQVGIFITLKYVKHLWDLSYYVRSV